MGTGSDSPLGQESPCKDVRRSSSGGSLPKTRAFHTLPNGDVRVIQTPPQDLIRAVVLHDNEEDESGRGDEPKTVFPSASEMLITEATAAITLMFECTIQQLKLFTGAHFHIGELVVDADLSSIVRREVCERRKDCVGQAYGCDALLSLWQGSASTRETFFGALLCCFPVELIQRVFQRISD
jgi:hypothetical protein